MAKSTSQILKYFLSTNNIIKNKAKTMLLHKLSQTILECLFEDFLYRTHPSEIQANFHSRAKVNPVYCPL